MNTDLTTAVPAPRRLSLGGIEFLASELTFASLGRLQAWIKANRPHPFEALKAQRADILRMLGPDEYRYLLSEAVEAGKSWPPSPLSNEGRKLIFGDDAGGAEFLRALIGQHAPEPSPEEALAMIARGTPEEMRACFEVAYGVAPQVAAEAELTAAVEEAAGPPGPAPAGPATPPGATATPA